MLGRSNDLALHQTARRKLRIGKRLFNGDPVGIFKRIQNRGLLRFFQIFDEVYLLTGGGPGRETYMIVQNIYEVAFIDTQPDYGQAAAGSVLMAVIIAIFTFFQLWLTRRQSEF